MGFISLINDKYIGAGRIGISPFDSLRSLRAFDAFHGLP